jgi:ABC-type methionine transport system ATPase subunit
LNAKPTLALHCCDPLIDFGLRRGWAGVGAAVNSLSGGNQQKVLVGRYLAADVGILLIEETTRGVDIGAKSEIYRVLREFARKGRAVLVRSRETIELIGLCRICCGRPDVRHSPLRRKRAIGPSAVKPASDLTNHIVVEATMVGRSPNGSSRAISAGRKPARTNCHQARFSASPIVETIVSIWDSSMMSGGESAMMSPVTRISRPFLKQSTKMS